MIMEQMLLKVGIKPEKSTEKETIGNTRNEKGKEVEKILKNILDLKKERTPFKASRPDILDYKKFIVGEIKAISEQNGRAIMFTDQIERYIQLTSDINSFMSFNGNRPMSTMYYIGYYTYSEDIKSSEKKLKISDIYILGEDILNKILKYDAETTRWGLDGKPARIARTIDDNLQKRVDKSMTQESMMSTVIKKITRMLMSEFQKKDLMNCVIIFLKSQKSTKSWSTHKPKKMPCLTCYRHILKTI